MADEELDVMKCPYLFIEWEYDANHNKIETMKYCTHGTSIQRKKYLAAKCTECGVCQEIGKPFSKENYNDECIDFNNQMVEKYHQLCKTDCFTKDYMVSRNRLYDGNVLSKPFMRDFDGVVEGYHPYLYPSAYNDVLLRERIGEVRFSLEYNDSLLLVVSKTNPCRYEIKCQKLFHTYCKRSRTSVFIPNKVPVPDIDNCIQGICLFVDEEHTCPACGGVFTGAGWCNQKDGQLYCTYECMQQGSKPKIEPTKEKRVELTQDIKNQVLNRDGHKCILCGSTENLHVHHLIPLYAGGSNNLANLTTVCSKCHMKIHNNGGDYSVGNDDTEQKRLS